MHDVGVAHIDHAHILRGQIKHIVFMVVGAGMAEGKQRRRLANPARAETRARTPLGAHVVGCTKDRNVRIYGIPIGANQGFGKGAVTNEGQVQATGFVAVVRHIQASPTLLGEGRTL
ncbi:hypothetical protein D9M68_706870 [compost metagenome]